MGIETKSMKGKHFGAKEHTFCRTCISIIFDKVGFLWLALGPWHIILEKLVKSYMKCGIYGRLG